MSQCKRKPPCRRISQPTVDERRLCGTVPWEAERGKLAAPPCVIPSACVFPERHRTVRKRSEKVYDFGSTTTSWALLPPRSLVLRGVNSPERHTQSHQVCQGQLGAGRVSFFAMISVKRTARSRKYLKNILIYIFIYIFKDKKNKTNSSLALCKTKLKRDHAGGRKAPIQLTQSDCYFYFYQGVGGRSDSPTSKKGGENGGPLPFTKIKGGGVVWGGGRREEVKNKTNKV